MKHLKLFNDTASYEAWKNGEDYVNHAVSYVEENDTVGIIICKQDNEYVIKYCSDDRIIAREYELV